MMILALALLPSLAFGQVPAAKFPVREFAPDGHWLPGNVIESPKSPIGWKSSGLGAAIVTPKKEMRLLPGWVPNKYPYAPWFEEDFKFVSGDISPYDGKLSLDFLYEGGMALKTDLKREADPLPSDQKYLVLVKKVNSKGRYECLGLIPTEMKQLPSGGGPRSDFLNGLCECLTEKSEKTFEESLRWFGGYTFSHAVYPNLQPYNSEIPRLKSDDPQLDSQIAQRLQDIASGLNDPRRVYVSLLAGQMGASKLFWPFFAEVQKLSKTPKEIDPKVLFLTQSGSGWQQLTPAQSLALAKPFSGGELFMFFLTCFVKGDFSKDQLKQVYLNTFTGTKEDQRYRLQWLSNQMEEIASDQGDYKSTYNSYYPEGFNPKWHWPEGIIDESGLRHKFDQYFGITIKP